MVFRFKNLGRWLRKSRIKEELGHWLRKSKNQENQESKEEKMKKLIAVTAILSVMFLGAGTSQALMGTPDAVPGKNILIPFFLVSMTGSGSDNTLITITDVTGAGLGTEVGDSQSLHLNLIDIDSNVRLNKAIKITKKDVYVTDALTLINEMSTLNKAALAIDLDGNGTNDHYAGYIFFENMITTSGIRNDFMAHVYQVSTSDGMVAGYMGVSLEDSAGGGTNSELIGAYTDTTLKLETVEALSANGLYAAKQILAGSSSVDNAAWLRLMPRYYLHDEDSTNLLIVWSDVYDHNGNGKFTESEDIALPGDLHVNFYDEAEHVYSSTITIDHELTFINVVDVLPAGLVGTDPYGAGWINITTPDLQSDGYDNNAPNRYMLGYSLQRAMMADGTTLDVIFEAHRDAGTGTVPE